MTAIFRTSSPLQESGFVVYPIDTLGTQYTINIVGSTGYCDVIATEPGTLLGLRDKNGIFSLGQMTSGIKKTIQVRTTDGCVLHASQPVAVFCGDGTSSWNQMIPDMSLGDHYIVPNVDPYNAFGMTITLRVVATSDNTIVNITGDSDEMFRLEKRGDYHDTVYTNTDTLSITTNYPVSVGLQINEYSRTTYSILPAVDNFMDFPVTLVDADSFVVFVDSSGDGDLLTPHDYTVPQNQTFSMCVRRAYSGWTSGLTLLSYPTPSMTFKDLMEVGMAKYI